jgi:hypothetical protein
VKSRGKNHRGEPEESVSKNNARHTADKPNWALAPDDGAETVAKSSTPRGWRSSGSSRVFRRGGKRGDSRGSRKSSTEHSNNHLILPEPPPGSSGRQTNNKYPQALNGKGPRNAPSLSTERLGDTSQSPLESLPPQTSSMAYSSPDGLFSNTIAWLLSNNGTHAPQLHDYPRLSVDNASSGDGWEPLINHAGKAIAPTQYGLAHQPAVYLGRGNSALNYSGDLDHHDGAELSNNGWCEFLNLRRRLHPDVADFDKLYSAASGHQAGPNAPPHPLLALHKIHQPKEAFLSHTGSSQHLKEQVNPHQPAPDLTDSYEVPAGVPHNGLPIRNPHAGASNTSARVTPGRHPSFQDRLAADRFRNNVIASGSIILPNTTPPRSNLTLPMKAQPAFTTKSWRKELSSNVASNQDIYQGMPTIPTKGKAGDSKEITPQIRL